MNQLRPPARWSSAIDQARWIAERLGPFAEGVTSVVPAGFDAYARILHPAEEPGSGERLVQRNENREKKRNNKKTRRANLLRTRRA
jgi:hypothetical protein